MASNDLVSALRACAPYVHAHHGRIFVVCFGGEAAQRHDFDALIYDLALLHSLGVKLVAVHGVRPQIDAQLQSRGLKAQFVNGLRVTDKAALDCVKAAVGSLRMEIEARLSTSLASTPMGGARLKVASGNWITARPVGVREGVDHQHTGEVRRADAATLREVLDEGRVVLLSPIGYSPTGEIFNLRAEDVATATATALGADKLIFITPSDPMTWTLASGAGDAGQISLAEAKRLLSTEPSPLNDIDRVYVQAAIGAARGGVKRVHLISQEGEGLLLRELYTRDGAGLLIYADDSYDVTRDATLDDIGGILQLIQPLEKAGVLVPRSRAQLEAEIGNFMVMARDGMVIACCALYPQPDPDSGDDRLLASSGELACVAVHPAYRGAGRAAALLARVEQLARRQGMKKLFSLTTHTPHWFIERGFVQGTPDDLPAARAQLYNSQRNSLVLVKAL